MRAFPIFLFSLLFWMGCSSESAKETAAKTEKKEPAPIVNNPATRYTEGLHNQVTKAKENKELRDKNTAERQRQYDEIFK